MLFTQQRKREVLGPSHSSDPPPPGISYPVVVDSTKRRGTVPHAANMPMSATSPEVVQRMTGRPTPAKG
jgi:hypothetical protein